jgi:hypothetical protein
MLVENHRHGSVFQGPIAAVLLELMLDPACPLEQILEFLHGEIVKLQEMLELHNYRLTQVVSRTAGPEPLRWLSPQVVGRSHHHAQGSAE